MRRSHLQLTLLFIAALHFNFLAQVSFLNLNGLTNSSSINNRSIYGAPTTFNAYINNIGNANSPTVTGNGNIVMRMNGTNAKQCINLSFSDPVDLIVKRNNQHSPSFNIYDSLFFNTNNFTLWDQSSNFNVGNNSIKPNTSVTNYNNWQLNFTVTGNLKICATRSHNSSSGNTKIPIRIGIATSTLPVGLTTFQTTVLDNKVKCTWTTASERENDYFTLERSIDLQNWTEIEKVTGAGNSSIEKSYTSYDYSPITNDISYYRLKQTDFDGNYTYHDTRSLHFNPDQNQNIRLYPNPTDNELNVRFSFSHLNDIEIINNLGINVTDLVKKTKIGNEHANLNISQLSSGIYFLKINNETSKFYKN
ncbi:MAG: T9SS type A sorting domain-containing protein [Lishizhenia sp.]